MTEAAALSFLFRGRGQAMRLRICPHDITFLRERVKRTYNYFVG